MFHDAVRLTAGGCPSGAGRFWRAYEAATPARRAATATYVRGHRRSQCCTSGRRQHSAIAHASAAARARRDNVASIGPKPATSGIAAPLRARMHSGTRKPAY